jgi:hypothetical protein
MHSSTVRRERIGKSLIAATSFVLAQTCYMRRRPWVRVGDPIILASQADLQPRSKDVVTQESVLSQQALSALIWYVADLLRGRYPP